MPQPAQVIDGRHVDPHKLMKLLQSVYGTSEDGKVKFKVELRLNRYKIYTPDGVHGASLSEEQIQDCRQYTRQWG